MGKHSAEPQERPTRPWAPPAWAATWWAAIPSTGANRGETPSPGGSGGRSTGDHHRGANGHTTPQLAATLEARVVARHEQFRTQMALAMALGEEAIRHNVPFGVVVFDAWYLAEDLVQVLARRRPDWISLRKKNRLLETASLQLRDANG